MSSPTFPLTSGGSGGTGTSDHTQLTNRTSANQHPGSSVSLVTTGFDFNLSSADDTVQKAMDRLDDLVIIADAMIYKGSIDCSTNPNYPAADAGNTYRVSAAGKIGGASGTSVTLGQILICNTDATASGDQATVGAYWDIFESGTTGAVIGPASTTENYIPQWDSTTKKLKDGKAIGTTAGTIAAGDDSRFTDARTPSAHNLVDTTGHPVTGLTTGHFLKATGATAYGFGAHGLTASDVGAQPVDDELTSLAGLSLTGNGGKSITVKSDVSGFELTTVSGALDIVGLTAETSIADDDLIPIYDTSASANRKMTKANFVAGLGGGGSTFVKQFSIEGVVFETTFLHWVVPAAGTIALAVMSLESAPSATGSYCKVQVMKTGLLETNSVFTSDVPMQITEETSATNGVYQAAGTLDAGQVAVAAGDVIWCRVNQADEGSAGLVVQVKVNFT